MSREKDEGEDIRGNSGPSPPLNKLDCDSFFISERLRSRLFLELIRRLDISTSRAICLRDMLAYWRQAARHIIDGD